jgi:general secretion pathway protein D
MLTTISLARRTALAALVCSAVTAPLLGQNRANTTRPAQAPRAVTTPTINRAGGGGGGGASASAMQRQYPNSTTVGDALITSDTETRRIIVITDEETNDNIKNVIATLDKPKPQVLINVVFVQVTHSNDLDLGAEATYRGEISLGDQPYPTGTGTTKFGLGQALNDPTHYGAFYRILGQHGLEATLHALAAKNKTEILSRPSILTRSSQQATIMVGQSVPIITNSRISDQTNTTINTVQYTDIGIILRVTPFITQEGLVEMIVSPEISSLSATTVPISNTVSSPVIDKRAADTVVVTPSDQTVVIGGLISTQTTDRDSKVPILGDIPLLGYAFKRKVKADSKTELLIFLTPHVVRTPDELSQVAAQERAQMDLAPKAFPREEMERYLGPK